MIQFCYGDDGQDPAVMEGDGNRGSQASVNLAHLWDHVHNRRPIHGVAAENDTGLPPFAVRGIAEDLLRNEVLLNCKSATNNSGMKKQYAEDIPFFVNTLRKFVHGKAAALAEHRVAFGLPRLFDSPCDVKTSRVVLPGNEAREGTLDTFLKECSEFHAVAPYMAEGEAAVEIAKLGKRKAVMLQHAVDNVSWVNRENLEIFLRAATDRYARAFIEPGTAVGAVGAQSIGEPGTQMTLKTFHFAGIAAMNITQGVPRIKEIINASKNIATPVIFAPLEAGITEDGAQRCKARIERTELGHITDYIEEIFTPDRAYLLLKLDLKAIRMLKVSIDLQGVIDAMLSTSSLKLKPMHIRPRGSYKIEIEPPASAKSGKFFVLQSLRAALPKVVVKGDKNVKKAILSTKIEKGAEQIQLVVEGTDMRVVMSARGVDGRKVNSNVSGPIRPSLYVPHVNRFLPKTAVVILKIGSFKSIHSTLSKLSEFWVSRQQGPQS